MSYTSKFFHITNSICILKFERLWNGSWADDSVRWDEVNRVAYEPSRIKKIEHADIYYCTVSALFTD